MRTQKIPSRQLVYSFLLLAAAIIASLALPSCNTAPATYTVGGTVANLTVAASGLVLQDNLKDSLTLNSNGAFTFPTPLPVGSSYGITISAQPSNPAQLCSVTNASGTVSGNVTNIQVNCGHNEWTWVTGASGVNVTSVYGTQGVPSMNNTPGARQQPVSWTDASGNFWLFGGYARTSTSQGYAFMNDLWKYSDGQWTWVAGSNVGVQSGTYGTLGVAATTNAPGPRYQAVGWTDASGKFWLFGGSGYDSAGNQGTLNDLWKFSGGEWTWMGGSDLADQPGVYSTLGVAAASNIPSTRLGAIGWADWSGDFWLFGGFHRDSSMANGPLNDLWKYSNGEWTWESGSSSPNQPGTYPPQGASSPNNVPGSRQLAVGWTDTSGNFWLFGGNGLDSANTLGLLNDLWKYSDGQWTWISGSNLANENGFYGTQGILAPGNISGARAEQCGWIDLNGNLWLFGGYGFPGSGTEGNLNDLWMYMP